MDKTHLKKFKKSKKVIFWPNYIFVVLLVISLVFYIFVEYKINNEKNTMHY